MPQSRAKLKANEQGLFVGGVHGHGHLVERTHDEAHVGHGAAHVVDHPTLDAAGAQQLLAGRYRMGPPIGEGGSAQVFRAHDELRDRPVAGGTAGRRRGAVGVGSGSWP